MSYEKVLTNPEQNRRQWLLQSFRYSAAAAAAILWGGPNGLAQTSVTTPSVTSVGSALPTLPIGPAPSVSSAIPQNVPAVLAGPVAAVGTRLSAPGQERLIVTGTLNQSGNQTPISLTYQSPRLFVYQSAANKVAFNGSNQTSLISSAQNDALVESLFEDSIDGLAFNLRNARLLRLLMNRARIDDGRTPNYSGPYLDVYQIALPVPSVSGSPTRIKHLYFDSTTHLLDRVRYRTGSSQQTLVETRFSNWTTVNGSSAPQTISRLENTATMFTVTATNLQIQPAGSTSIFTAIAAAL